MFSRLTTRMLKTQMVKAQPRVALTQVAQRGFISELGLESTSIEAAKGGKEEGIALWKDYEDQSKALTLKTDDEISNYIIGITKEYFRSTKKAKIGVDSLFKDHGLDSLDVIELIIQVEDDLGYVIDAENLTKFQKPKHFVNFIKQVEAYREEYGKLPHEHEKASFNIKEAFPMPAGVH